MYSSKTDADASIYIPKAAELKAVENEINQSLKNNSYAGNNSIFNDYIERNELCTGREKYYDDDGSQEAKSALKQYGRETAEKIAEKAGFKKETQVNSNISIGFNGLNAHGNRLNAALKLNGKITAGWENTGHNSKMHIDAYYDIKDGDAGIEAGYSVIF